MLGELDIVNFTAFEKATFKFSSGLNVIVGANGTGKSHVLKLAYSVVKTSHNQHSPNKQSKAVWQKAVADDLVAVFKPESLGRLVRRKQGRAAAMISIGFNGLTGADFAFGFSTLNTTDVKMEGSVPVGYAPTLPIFIPTKELLSMFPGLRALYNSRELAIDATYPDLCGHLEHPLLRGARLENIRGIVESLEDLIGGEVRNEQGRFYLYGKDGVKLEMDLVAEGMRKLATLAYLLKNGSLTESAVLFWDEPEANMNPALLKKLAAVLMELSLRKFQVIIATHSLFLLKELHIFSQEGAAHNARYFGLATDENNASRVVQTDHLEELPHITSLEAELEQADRFSDALDKEDAYSN